MAPQGCFRATRGKSELQQDTPDSSSSTRSTLTLPLRGWGCTTWCSRAGTAPFSQPGPRLMPGMCTVGGFPARCKGRPHWAGLSAQTAWLVPTPPLPLGAENLGRQRLPTLLSTVKTLGTEPLTCKCPGTSHWCGHSSLGSRCHHSAQLRERLESEASRGQGA